MFALTCRLDTGAIKAAFKAIALASVIVSGVALSAVIAQAVLPAIVGALAVFLAFLCGLAHAVVAMIAHAVVFAATMGAYSLLGAVVIKVATLAYRVNWRKAWEVVKEWLWIFKALALAGLLVGCFVLTILAAPFIFNAAVAAVTMAVPFGIMKGL